MFYTDSGSPKTAFLGELSMTFNRCKQHSCLSAANYLLCLPLHFWVSFPHEAVIVSHAGLAWEKEVGGGQKESCIVENK